MAQGENWANLVLTLGNIIQELECLGEGQVGAMTWQSLGGVREGELKCIHGGSGQMRGKMWEGK